MIAASVRCWVRDKATLPPVPLFEAWCATHIINVTESANVWSCKTTKMCGYPFSDEVVIKSTRSVSCNTIVDRGWVVNYRKLVTN